MYNKAHIETEITELRKYTPRQKAALTGYLEALSEDNIYYLDTFQRVKQIEGVPVTMLAYAAGAYKIASVMQFSNIAEKVERAIMIVVAHFADNYLNIWNEREKESAAVKLKKLVLKEYAERMSLFGLIHAFNLIADSEPPCDTRMESGYDGKGIRQNLNRYCSASINDYAKLLTDIRLKREGEAPLINLKQMSELNERIKSFEEKIAEKTKAIDMQSQREFSKKIAAGEIDPEEIIENQMEAARKKQLRDSDYIPFE